MDAVFIDCDYIIYCYTNDYIKANKPKYSVVVHAGLNDYNSTCNSGLWRDGSFSNALLALRIHNTDALHVMKNNMEILTITRETPKVMYCLA